MDLDFPGLSSAPLSNENDGGGVATVAAPPPSNSLDLTQAAKFAALLTQNQPATWQLICEKGHPIKEGFTDRGGPQYFDTFDNLSETFQNWNLQYKYFPAISRAITGSPKRSKSKVTGFLALVAEKDNGAFDFTRLPPGFPEPSILVQSRNGQHAYWLLNQPDTTSVAAYEELSADLAALLDGDPALKNPTLPMRVPGFLHQKDGGLFVPHLLKASEARYTFADLRKACPSKPPILRIGKGGRNNVAASLLGRARAGGLEIVPTYADYLNRTVFTSPLEPDRLEATRQSIQNYQVGNRSAPHMAYFLYYLHDFRVKYDGVEFYKDGQSISEGELLALMANYADTIGLTGIKKQKLENSLTEFKREEKKKAIEELREKLSYSPHAEDLVTQAVGLFCEPTVANIAAFRQLLWQVKRALYGLPIEHTLMGILYGAQGGGKTTFLRKLISPFGNFAGFHGDLSRLVSDPNETLVLTNWYAVVLDEMGRADKAAVDQVKNVITSGQHTLREMYRQSHRTVKILSTFFGASNLPVGDLLRDPTGNRRFYQFNCDNYLEKNHEAINTFDFEALWESVDENAESPAKANLAAIQRVQKGQRAHNPIEEFLTECKGLVMYNKGPVLVSDLYNSDPLSSLSYVGWCKKNGYSYPLTRHHFQQELLRLGYAISKDRDKRTLVTL